MLKHDVIPEKDEDFDKFQLILIAMVQANAVAWNIPAAIITAILPHKTNWDAKWAVAKNKATRTSTDVQAKKDARAAYEPALRSLISGGLANNPYVTNEQRVEMGLNIRDKNPTPRPKPATKPDVTLKAHGNTQIMVTYEQEEGTEGDTRPRAKPEGVARMELVYKIGDPAPVSANDCPKTVSITRSPYKLNFEPADSGKKLYAFARWVNTRNIPGDWCGILIVVIP